MVANAMLVAVAILLGYLFWLMGELKFLANYRAVIFKSYRKIIFGWF
jgi:hypothetical protein